MTLGPVPADVDLVLEQDDGTLVRDRFYYSGWAELPVSFLLSPQGGAVRTLFLMGFGRPPWATFAVLCDTMIPSWPVAVATTADDVWSP